MRRKFFSILLSLAMVITMMPAMSLSTFGTETNNQSSVVLLKAKVSGSKAIKLSWTKVDNATKYVIYGARCGKSYKKLTSLKSNTYTVKKIKKQKLKAHKTYKFYVVAYSGATKLAKSRSLHYITANTSGKYGNVTKITATKKVLNLKVGETAKLGSKVKIYKNKRHLPKAHGNARKYTSKNSQIARVSSTGTVTAVSKGTTTIYIQDIGGLYCKTTVNVESVISEDEEAFNTYKQETLAKCDALLKSDSTDEQKTLVANAKTKINNLKFDSSKSLADNKAAIDSIYNELKNAISGGGDNPPGPTPGPTNYTVTFAEVTGGAIYNASSGGTKVTSIEVADGATVTTNNNKITIGGTDYYASADSGYIFKNFGVLPPTITTATTITPVFDKQLTVAQILPAGFPTSADSAWVNASGQKAYKEENNIKVGNLTLGKDTTVTKSGDNYVCTSGDATVTFNVKDGAVKSIAVSGTTDSDGTYAALDYVEIGGVKWATKNLGAKNVTDYGDYFAWGETAPYYEGTGGWPATLTWKSEKASGYAWQSYCGSSSFSEWSTPPYDATTKILKPEFDAAAQILGNGWRMPTKEEFKALYDACFNGSYDDTTDPSGASASVGKGVYWCTNYDGVAGCLFCDGTNKLFFPAAGEGTGTNLSYADSTGYYWSSSLGSSTSYAYYLRFAWEDVDPQYDYDRCLGFSVRPVKDAATPLPAGALAGEFSVSATKKVHFSQGNLVATIDASGAPTAWKFSAHQYDYLGEGGANKTIGATAGDVDLFGWSTSTNSGTSTTDNYGIKTSNDDSEYSGDFYDWGKAVGDDNTWRTLSKDEWTYLFNTRTVNGGTGAGKSYSLNITYGGKMGVVLYPDDYTGSVLSGTVDSLPEGVVFLPAAGSRSGGVVLGVDTYNYGTYWSSTVDAENEDYAYSVDFDSNGVTIGDDSFDLYNGYSVRLVTEVK